jgi:hypothetical protein
MAPGKTLGRSADMIITLENREAILGLGECPRK